MPDARAVADEVTAAHPGVDVVVATVAHSDGTDAVRGTGRRAHGRAGRRVGGREVVADQRPARRRRDGHRRRAAGDAKGRHTTTTREAHPLPGGGVLIDTPGLRSVGISADPDAVAATFGDIDDLAAHCRFSDCGHDGEPGCAVAAAVASGDLSSSRLAGWRALEAEAAAAELRANPHLLPRAQPPLRPGGPRGPAAQARRALTEPGGRSAVDDPDEPLPGGFRPVRGGGTTRGRTRARPPRPGRRARSVGVASTRRSTVRSSTRWTSQPANPAVRRAPPRSRSTISTISGTRP